MSSSDFVKVCVQDDILNTTDKVSYAVFKGAQNITPSQYEAISKSNSSVTWNIQLPSESTVFSRRIMLRVEMELVMTATFSDTAPVGSYLFNYGYASALSPFPFQSLCNTIQATINNNTVSQNMRDVMFQLLRFNDRRELARYNNATPTMYDSYQNYNDALGTLNNPLAGWNNVANDQDFQPRGSFELTSVTGNTPKTADPNPQQRVITIKFTTTEPLMLSPFIFSDPKSNNQGMYGVQTLNFTANLGLPNKVLRLANQNFALDANNKPLCTVALADGGEGIKSALLLMEFYTRQPSDLVSSRNVVPFAEYPRYITPLPVSNFTSGATSGFVNFQSIQLNSVPDKLIFCCRKVLGSQSNFDTDSFLPIKKISINFNNKAGLLSSATEWDLWRMSVESGSNQTFQEFKGYATVGSNAPITVPISQNYYKKIPLCGSILALEMGRHVELDDVYAPGSIGAFQLQFQVQFENNTADTIPANSYEMVLITMNSGVFTIERGTSQTYTSILSRADVLSVSSQPSQSKSSLARLVGGSWEDSFKSLCSSIAPWAGRAEKVKDVIMGEGTSGGGTSGGGYSGGRLKKHLAM